MTLTLDLRFLALAAAAGAFSAGTRSQDASVPEAGALEAHGVAIPGQRLPAASIGPSVIEGMDVALARERAARSASAPREAGAASTPRAPEALTHGASVAGESPSALVGTLPNPLPNLVVEFAGPDQSDPGAGWIPADAHGAAGPNHFVAVVNQHLSVYDKATTTRVLGLSLQSFFGGSASILKGSPRVAYDHHAGRWVLIATDFASGIHFAWSTSSDPTGSWYKTFILLAEDEDAGTWPEYPTLGLDVEGIYVGAHMVGNALSLFAIDKGPLLPLVPSIVTVTAWRSLNGNGALQPCLTYGNPPGCYVTSRVDFDTQRIRRVDPPLETPTLTSLGTVATKIGNAPPSAPALGSSVNLDTLDARHMNSVYRNGSIWLTHCVVKTGRAAINWYEIDPLALAVVQEGTVKSDVDSYCYPTIAVNSAGDAVLGFSASSPAMYAGAWYTGRRSTELPGEMAAPAPYQAGAGPYNQLASGVNRWGSYSMTTVDPSDDLGFWTIQELALANGTWGTHIAELGFACSSPLASPPADAAHCPGESASFATTASGTGPFTYQWQKDGADIPGATAASHAIASVTPADAGSYACLVGNACGSITSAPADLTVLEPLGASNPSGASACPLTAVAFSTSASGSGPFSYQWRKNGAAIPGATGATFTIASVAAGDAGSYDAVVTGACGSLTTGSAALVVLTPPSATDPSGASACPGTGVAFSTTASGSGPLTYQWRKNGAGIPGATGATYSIPAVTAGNAGAYDVVVTGACGSLTTGAAVLAVLEPPSASDPSPAAVCPGESVGFSTSASGSGPFSYQWRKDGAEIPGATGATYAIPSAMPGDEGAYDVVVTGACGSLVTNAAALVVDEPVTATDPADLTLCPGLPAVFSTTAGGTGPFTYQWKRDGVALAGANGSSHAIASVASGDAGDYSVEVSGACGTIETAAATLALGGPVVSYCTAGTSTSGCQALLSATGVASASLPSGFSQREHRRRLEGRDLYFGTNGRQANSWGNGTSYQCVAPPAHRAGVLEGTGTNNQCNGSFSQDLNAQWQAKPHHNPGAGALVQIQLWYRDPHSTSNQTTSLSDALETPVCP